MSPEQAIEHFVAPMRRSFSVPQGLNQDDFLGDLAESLSGFSVAQLQAASKWFRDTRETRTFPTVAECRRACERYPTDGQQAAVRRRVLSDAERAAEREIERQRELEAWKMCRCHLGRRADREGWLPALIEFAADHGRLPLDREVDGCMAKSRRSEEAMQALRGPDGKMTALGRTVEGFRKAMLDRAHQNVFGFLDARAAPAPLAAE